MTRTTLQSLLCIAVGCMFAGSVSAAPKVHGKTRDRNVKSYKAKSPRAKDSKTKKDKASRELASKLNKPTTELSAKHKRQVRGEIRKQMSRVLDLGPHTRLRTQFTPRGKRTFTVSARVTGKLDSDHDVVREASGVFRLPANGTWKFESRAAEYGQALYTPSSAIEAIRLRDHEVGNVVVVGKDKSSDNVMYTRTGKLGRGQGLFVASVARGGRRQILRTSRDLAPAVIAKALAAARKTPGAPTGFLKELASDGRSVKVQVYSTTWGGPDVTHRRVYRVGIDAKGAPNGDVERLRTTTFAD